jgi:hypothetical protein
VAGRAVAAQQQRGTTRNTGESPLEILDHHLASGQIDLETWQAHRAALLGAQGDRK